MKILIAILLFPFLFLQNSYAYTIDEVNLHNTPNDCWVVFEDSVYDLSKYLPSHDIYMDIRDWCGKDMTEDFKTKAGMDRDHRVSSYSLLENYKIGEIESNQAPIIEEEDTIEDKIMPKNASNPYNLIIPLLISNILYWIPYLLIKKRIIKVSLKSFNAFWNTLLILLLLLPSLGFGVFMMLRYRFPGLWNI
ncbi:MAG TPA: cytochrome b5 domain-containing protein, partial [Candidatus Dojkabacteria bacterium]|nr:cytochrome b5 domain-containing protein [Candidatus Dojkabacteria bacterium]